MSAPCCSTRGLNSTGWRGEIRLAAYDETQQSQHLTLFGDRGRSGNLAPGRYRLEVRGEGGKRIGDFTAFEIRSGEQTDFEFELPRDPR